MWWRCSLTAPHDKNIEIASVVAADVPEVLEIDAPRLKQVLFNVIGNAVKFTDTGGVLVSAELQNAELVITVSDTGPGLTREAQQRIFEAFEQAGDAAGRSGGTGLGLAISRRIMAAFNGSLTVSSAPGQGSTFTIRLPLPANSSLSPDRSTLLSGSTVLLMAPDGRPRQRFAPRSPRWAEPAASPMIRRPCARPSPMRSANAARCP